MIAKCLILICALAAVCSAGVIPAVPAIPAAVPAALTIGTYASSYNAHSVDHALAAPYAVAAPHVATPIVAAPAAVAHYPALPVAHYIAAR